MLLLHNVWSCLVGCLVGCLVVVLYLSCSCLVQCLLDQTCSKAVSPPALGTNSCGRARLGSTGALRCLWVCDCEPCGERGMRTDVAPARPAEQEAQRQHEKNKHYQKARDGSPGGHACKAAPIFGDLFDRFAGRQPQTWDCRWTKKPKDFPNTGFPRPPPFQSWGVKGYP